MNASEVLNSTPVKKLYRAGDMLAAIHEFETANALPLSKTTFNIGKLSARLKELRAMAAATPTVMHFSSQPTGGLFGKPEPAKDALTEARSLIARYSAMSPEAKVLVVRKNRGAFAAAQRLVASADEPLLLEFERLQREDPIEAQAFYNENKAQYDAAHRRMVRNSENPNT